MNNSTSLYFPTNQPPNQANGVIFGCIVLPGLALNLMAVVITITVAKRHPVPHNSFLVALAFVDLTSILLTTTPTGVYYIYRGWCGGRVVCVYQGIMSIFSTIATGSVAAIIALDRCLATLKPLWYYTHRENYNGALLAVMVLVCVLIFSLLPLAGLGEIDRFFPGTYCALSYSPKSPLSKRYTLVFAILCLFEGVLVVACNTTVCVSMCRHRHQIQPLLGQMFNVLSSRRRNEVEYSRTMMAVSFSFGVCWTPFMIRTLCGLSDISVSPKFGAWIVRLLLLKFTLDPCIYLLTRRQYRKAFARLITCRRHRKSRGTVTAGLTEQARASRAHSDPFTVNSDLSVRRIHQIEVQ